MSCYSNRGGQIKWDKDGKDRLLPQEISVSHLFDHTMSSKATCACTELALAANHVRLGKDRNVCLCVLVCVRYWVAVLKPKRQMESICSEEERQSSFLSFEHGKYIRAFSSARALCDSVLIPQQTGGWKEADVGLGVCYTETGRIYKQQVQQYTIEER